MMSGSMEKPTTSDVNSFVLTKHYLAARAKDGDIGKVVDGVCGLPATASSTPYLSLFARMEGFRREDLESELYRKRSLGKIRCMRGTVHVLTKAMLPFAHSATMGPWINRHDLYTRLLGMSEAEYRQIADRVLGALGKLDSGWTAREAKETLGLECNVPTVLNMMCDEGLLIRGRPEGGWKSNLHTYHALGAYFPDVGLNGIPEDRARTRLVSLYLESFGPATLTDIAWWTGLGKTEVRRVLGQLGSSVIACDVDGHDSELLMSACQQEAFANGKQSNVVNLLPFQDPYLVGYKERERYLDPEHREWIFDRSGNATSSILVNGRVVGVWDMQEKPEPVMKIMLLSSVERGFLRKIRESAVAMGRFVTDDDVKVRECRSMVPLTERTAGGFMTPLKGAL